MPAVQDLRAALPGAQIDWVVERAFVPLVARCAGVGRVIACELRRWRKAPLAQRTRTEWRAFKAELQQERYDLIIDAQGLTKSALVAWLARTTDGGKRVAMAHQTDGSGYEAPTRWVADHAVALPPRVHAVQRARLLCAAALGLPPATGPDVYGLTAGDQAVLPPVNSGFAGNIFLPRKPWVVLVHGTSRADKEWPQANWVQLGQYLNHAGFGVALAHGSAAERATSEAIAAQLDDAWVWPTMALDALTDTMARCAGVIGVDSGLSHIAVALGLPHVQIYNFDTAWRTGPLVLQPPFELPTPAAAPIADTCAKTSADTSANTCAPPAIRQVSVYDSPTPGIDAVWSAWDALHTPVLCR